jgi:hypothetical protein
LEPAVRTCHEWLSQFRWQRRGNEHMPLTVLRDAAHEEGYSDRELAVAMKKLGNLHLIVSADRRKVRRFLRKL